MFRIAALATMAVIAVVLASCAHQPPPINGNISNSEGAGLALGVGAVMNQ